MKKLKKTQLASAISQLAEPMWYTDGEFFSGTQDASNPRDITPHGIANRTSEQLWNNQKIIVRYLNELPVIGQVVQLQQDVISLEAKVDTHISETTQNFAEHTTKIEKNKTDISALRQDVNTNRTDISSVSTNLSNHKTQSAKDHQDQQLEIEQIKRDITTLENAVPESASTTKKGIIEIATKQEVELGSGKDLAVTADNLNLPSIKQWVTQQVCNLETKVLGGVPPETLDSFKEVADAFKSTGDAVQAVVTKLSKKVETSVFNKFKSDTNKTLADHERDISNCYSPQNKPTAGDLGALTQSVADTLYLPKGSWEISGQDLKVHGKRALVGTTDRKLYLSYGGDFTHVYINTFRIYNEGYKPSLDALPGTARNSSKLNNLGSSAFSRAYSSSLNFDGSSGNWTTAQFIAFLKSKGAFSQPHWVARGSWSYANNKTITDTGCGNIHLSGCVVEVWGSESNYTIQIITPSTTSNGGTTNATFVYVNNGSAYAPKWKKMYDTLNKPTASDVGALTQSIADNRYYSINKLPSLGVLGALKGEQLDNPIWGSFPERWYLIGTLTMPQSSSTFLLDIVSGSGFNVGNKNQLGTQRVYIRAGNGNPKGITIKVLTEGGLTGIIEDIGFHLYSGDEYKIWAKFRSYAANDLIWTIRTSENCIYELDTRGTNMDNAPTGLTKGTFVTSFNTENKPTKNDVGLNLVENRAFKWQWGSQPITHMWGSSGSSDTQEVFNADNVRTFIGINNVGRVQYLDGAKKSVVVNGTKGIVTFKCVAQGSSSLSSGKIGKTVDATMVLLGSNDVRRFGLWFQQSNRMQFLEFVVSTSVSNGKTTFSLEAAYYNLSGGGEPQTVSFTSKDCHFDDFMAVSLSCL